MSDHTKNPPADLDATLAADRATRLARVAQAAAAQGVDAVAVTPGPDLRWLTGYAQAPSERLTVLLIPADPDAQATLVVPQLEVLAVPTPDVEALNLRLASWAETEDPFACVTEALRETPVRRLALDNHMWAQKVLGFLDCFPTAELVVAEPVISPIRMVKSPAEVAALRHAAACIDRVHARMAEFLRVGITEREAGQQIEHTIYDEGQVGLSFEVIVGSGPNGASPHHRAAQRRIEAGDPVVVDIGGVTAQGYCSDCTRTYVVGGEPPEEFTRYYEVLHRAQQAAVAAVRPGVSAASIDEVARQIITEAGYGEKFIHRTGHGIGLEVHEQPYLGSTSTITLEPGMVFSVEPGIYLEGEHGARLEDIVAVTQEGCESLNTAERSLRHLPG